jgi:uncharacterized protein (TIGR01777 family)
MFSLGRSVDRICAVKIVITGGTGFLGRPLAAALAAQGHEVVVLSRFAGGTYQGVRHQRAQIQADAFDQDAAATIASADAVINLAGAGIADERWTPARKAVLRQSRTSVTRAVATALKASTKPCVLVSGSAVGYYGSSLEATFDETAPAGSDFLATLCADWEREALAAASATCRVVLLRTGLVLARDGGLLAKLTPPFRFFVGGPVGDGRHWMSWIHRDDWIGLVTWALTNDAVRGPLNAVAPNPATNADFSRALGRALHRPSLFPVPAFVLRAIFGEMADGAILASQRVTPRVANTGGYHFAYPQLDEAMRRAV